MKQDLIQTEDYLILVSDVKPKKGDWTLSLSDDEDYGVAYKVKYDGYFSKEDKLIIGYSKIGNVPELDGIPLLDDIDTFNIIKLDFSITRGKKI